MRVLLICLALLLAAPAAADTDPPADKAFPASGAGVQIPSHGDRMNAMVYQPAGAGPHPVLLLFYGLPGNEQNLDLAQAARRQGWVVVTFHYRGSWGSGGRFSLENAVADADAVLDAIRDPARAKAWRMDPSRVAVAGHSMGGYVAASLAARHPEILGAALVAPWDISADVAAARALTPEKRAAFAAQAFDDTDGRLGATMGPDLLAEVIARGDRLDLGALAPALAQRPLFVAVASRDSDDDRALTLLPALDRAHAKALTRLSLDTDHGFNDKRLTLQAALLTWLASLPGAPPAR